MKIPSRKRYQEALRACKQVARNDKQSALVRLRAAEIICIIYGLELPGAGVRKKDKRYINELLTERRFEKQLKQQVQDGTAQDAGEAENTEQQQRVAQALESLKEHGDAEQ